MSLLLIALYASSPLSRELYRGSFTRNFDPNVSLTPTKVKDLESDSYYIAGSVSGKLYLANSTSPSSIAIIDSSLTELEHVKVKITGLNKIAAPTQFKLAIDSPYFYLVNGYMAEILRGKLGQWEVQRFMPDSGYYFAEVVPMSFSSFALRSYNGQMKEFELARKTNYYPYFKFEPDLLQKQIDGIFCVDGKLHYSPSLNQLIYLYNYRNEFIVADTNLNLRYRGHTLDTFSHAKIKAANIESKGQHMLQAPPARTNKTSCVYKNYLFVQSGVLAQNEDSKRFMEENIVDVYELSSGTYLKSFYLKNDKKTKLYDFKVCDGYIAALYDHHMAIYTFSPE